MNAIINIPTRAEFVSRIESAFRSHVFDVGRILLEAKAALPHGEFLDMLENDLRFSADRAERYMAIARNPEFVNSATLRNLPPSTQAILATLEPAELDSAVASGTVHSRTTTEDARRLVHHREPIHAAPRGEEDLRLPVTNFHELLATMKGYRHHVPIPQRELDEVAGLQEGYVSKLEVDIRRAINASWWDWLGALKLVMILVPARDAIVKTKCPCCGANRQA